MKYLKNSRGISLVKLILIIVAIIIVINIFVNNVLPKQIIAMEREDFPSVEYYELRLAATQSEIYGGYGKGTFSLESFNTLGRAIKKAHGKWFKDNTVNFKVAVLEAEDLEDFNLNELITDEEVTVLSDGQQTAIFIVDNESVRYSLNDFDYPGYRITIK